MSDLNQTHRALVAYCDGSIFGEATQKTPVGSGMHAVLFGDETYDGRVLDKEHLFTNRGYLYKTDCKSLKTFPEKTSKEEFIRICKDETVLAKPIWIREYSFGWSGYGTNSIAELRGMNAALELILETKADFNIVYCDSEYVLTNLAKNLPKWIKNNWMTSQGQPVANQDDWKAIYMNILALARNNIQYALRKIKGHKDAKGDKNSAVNMSNEYADWLAKMGSSLSNNIKCKEYLRDGLDETIKPYGTDGSYYIMTEQTLAESLAERKADKIHPFLVAKRYYTGFGKRPNRTRHYIGNPGHQVEDIYIGKQIPDGSLGIIQLSEENQVLNTVEDIQNIWLEQHYQHDNYVTTFMLDTISNSKDYALLEKYGRAWITRRNNTVPNLRTISGKELTYVNDPLYLSLENLNHLKEMENILGLYKSQAVTITDITDTLYDTVEMATSEALKAEVGSDLLKVGKSLKKSIDGTMKSIQPVVKFGGDGLHDEVNLQITLSAGIDMPQRNQLKSIETEYPLVQVLSWNKDGQLYAFGFIIFTHKLVDDKLVQTGYGFWRGTFASQLFIK